MILKLPPNQEFALRKLALNGVEFDGGPVTTDSDGVLLNGVSVDDRVVFSPVVVTVRKNAVLVSLNPRIGEILGYQPAFPTVLGAGFWGVLDLYTQGVDETQAAELQSLGWAVKLHFVPVQGFSN